MTTDQVRDLKGMSMRLRTPRSASPGPRRPHRVVAALTAGGLALTGAIALTPVAASAAVASRTTITGWSTAPATVTVGSAPAVRIRVTSALTGTRAVTLQRRRAGGTVWYTIARVNSSSAGYATLRLPVPAGHWQFKVYVPATRTSALALSGVRTLTGVPAALSPLARDLLARVNAARSVARMCGKVRYPAAPPLAYNAALGKAAQGYATLMATRNFFSHTYGSSTPTSRAQAAGYRGWAGWENIAAGYPNAAAVMAGWLQSPGHCANIMDRSLQELGVGEAYSARSKFGTYWVQDFGIRR